MSKGLEALEDLYKYTSPYINVEDIDEGHANTCFQIIQKELQALDIIKKVTNIGTFINYNLDSLSQKEYDLLKEVLL